MGCKFYRGSDRPKKIHKRLVHSRSWFRMLKWVACKYQFYMLINPQYLFLFNFRSRTSNFRGWSSIQGRTGYVPRLLASSRHEEIQYSIILLVRSTKTKCHASCRCCRCWFPGSIIRWLLRYILQWSFIQRNRTKVLLNDGRHEEMLWKPLYC